MSDLGKASVQYNDLTGTAAADHADFTRIHEYFGFDESWQVVSVELAMYEHLRFVQVYGFKGSIEAAEAQMANGQLEVTRLVDSSYNRALKGIGSDAESNPEFVPDETTVEQAVEAIFKRFAVVLLNQKLFGAKLADVEIVEVDSIVEE